MITQITENPLNGESKTIAPATQPAIMGFSPSTGSAGSTVLVTGTGFCDAIFVMVGGVTAPSMQVVDDNNLTFVVPDGAFSGPVSLVYPNREPLVSTTPFYVEGTETNRNISADVFSSTTFTDDLVIRGGGITPGIFPPPVILPPPTSAVITGYSANPTTTGTPLIIYGSGFTTVSGVFFTGAPAVVPTSVSSTQINVVVPAGATSGPVTVLFSSGVAASGPNLSFSVTSFFPAITGYAPNPAFRGNTITILGSGLPFGAAVKVTFAGGAQVNSTVSLNGIMVTVPASAMTGVVNVKFPGFDINFPGPVLRVYTSIRAVTGYNPNPGKRSKPLAITGGGFNQLSAIAFQGITGPIFAEGFTRDPISPDNQVSVMIPFNAFSNGRVRLFFNDGSFLDGPVLPIFNV